MMVPCVIFFGVTQRTPRDGECHQEEQDICLEVMLSVSSMLQMILR